MKARVNTETGKVLSVGEGKYPTDGEEVIVYNGNIPAFDRTEDLFYANGGMTIDKTNPHTVEPDNAKNARNARRGRLRADMVDPSLRGGSPGLEEKIDDIIKMMEIDGQLENEV